MNHIYKDTMEKIADMYDLSVVEYNALPIESVHLNSIVSNRIYSNYGSVDGRNFFKKLAHRICNKIFVQSYFMAMTAVFKDALDIKGHTHTILLKKN